MAEYIPLAANTDDDHVDIDDTKYVPSPRSTTSPLTRYTSQVLFSALLVSIISFVWASGQFISSFNHIAAPPVEVKALRRPSSYQGLGKVPDLRAERVQQESKNANIVIPMDSLYSPPKDVSGAPDAIAMVNTDLRHRAYPQDGWVLLSERENTLLEFKTSPSSSCTLHAFWPDVMTLRDGNKMLTLESTTIPSEPIHIEVRSLAGVASLTGRNVTYSSLAPSGSLLGTIHADFGMNDTLALDRGLCSGGNPLLLEVHCVGTCRVEYKEEGETPEIGFHLL